MQKSIVLLLSLLLFSSCLETKATLSSEIDTFPPTDELFIGATMVGPIMQPLFPLIDADIFNKKTNEFSEELTAAQQEHVNSYKKILLDKLQKTYQITTPSDIGIRPEGIQLADGQHDTIIVNSENHPYIYVADGDFRLDQFKKAKNIEKMFATNEELKQQIKDVCEAYDYYHLVVSYSRVSVMSVSAFGAAGNVRLESYLFMYSKYGKLLFTVTGVTKPISTSGKVLEDYTDRFDEYDYLSSLMVQEFKNFVPVSGS